MFARTLNKGINMTKKCFVVRPSCVQSQIIGNLFSPSICLYWTHGQNQSFDLFSSFTTVSPLMTLISICHCIYVYKYTNYSQLMFWHSLFRNSTRFTYQTRTWYLQIRKGRIYVGRFAMNLLKELSQQRCLTEQLTVLVQGLILFICCLVSILFVKIMSLIVY